MHGHYQAFRQFLPQFSVHYAMKCNPDAPLLRYLLQLGSKFEVASYPELQALVAIGANPAAVLFSNPVKIASHILDAARTGVYRFAFDSREELKKIAQYAPGASVYIRLAVNAYKSTVESEGKFGVSVAVGAQLMQLARTLGLNPYGITFHVGSQMENPRAWAQAIRQSGRLMHILRRAGIRINMLDMGGGFPAHHRGSVPSLALLASHIQKAMRAELPYQPENLVIEPGRGLVGDAGVMAATVIGLAQRGRKKWAHLDVGAFNGMMESLETQNNLNFPLADSRNSPKKAIYNLTGPSCDSQDTILFGCNLSANLKVGDRVFIYTAGAYTTSYASRFNGFDIPATYYAPEK